MARLETTISVTGLGVAVGAAEGEEVGGEEREYVVGESAARVVVVRRRARRCPCTPADDPAIS